jgi:hypothetical protein
MTKISMTEIQNKGLSGICFGYLNIWKLEFVWDLVIGNYFFPPNHPSGFPKSMRGTAPPDTCGKIPFHFSMLLY